MSKYYAEGVVVQLLFTERESEREREREIEREREREREMYNKKNAFNTGLNAWHATTNVDDAFGEFTKTMKFPLCGSNHLKFHSVFLSKIFCWAMVPVVSALFIHKS